MLWGVEYCAHYTPHHKAPHSTKSEGLTFLGIRSADEKIWNYWKKAPAVTQAAVRSPTVIPNRQILTVRPFLFSNTIWTGMGRKASVFGIGMYRDTCLFFLASPANEPIWRQ